MNLALITIVIIAANVIASMKGFEDYNFRNKYLFNVGAIHRGEHIRMISSGFLHGDFTHLLFNMLTLYFFANIVIINFGSTYFLLIYLAALLAGNLLSFYFHRNEYHYSALGASGAVTGVLFSAILLYPEMELFILFIPIPIKAYIFGIVYLAFSIYGMKKKLGNIGHDAHIGGAIAGFAITLALRPSIVAENMVFVVLLAIPILVLFILLKTGKLNS